MQLYIGFGAHGFSARCGGKSGRRNFPRRASNGTWSHRSRVTAHTRRATRASIGRPQIACLSHTVGALAKGMLTRSQISALVTISPQGYRIAISSYRTLFE
ncbi:hypothetical protein PUN4_990063 [Paraburkholderia unamae]|nr:hypothetical protein PUN4_990063 [Paraburkholderia unamae]